ncbi:MAG TPA: hypothetical protein VIZ00_03815 [Streptosporangiaceae bacterium]
MRLTQALAQDAGTAQARLDRDAAIVRYSEQLSRLDAAESGLCFGRLDLQTGERLQMGGPGTGKTAVALHRAAYLLYTHRHLAERGVLIVGPSATFVGYIGQVLPGLGETNVLLRTVGELFPGVAADRAEDGVAEEVKGRAMMGAVLAAAVRHRQGSGAAQIEFAGETLGLDGQVVAEAARRARATRLPHNQARPLFQRQIVAALAERYAERTREIAERIDADVADVLAEASAAIEADLAAIPELVGASAEDDEQLYLADLRRELWADPGVRVRLDDLWPALTPQRLLGGSVRRPGPARRRGAGPDRSRARRAAAPARWLEHRRHPAARRGGGASRAG